MQNKEIAQKYFDTFHAGNHAEMFTYLADDAMVTYGTAPAQPATVFYPEAKEMIAQLQFTTHGIFTAEQSDTVLIYFSFHMPAEDGSTRTVEAIDIIEFNADQKIQSVKVIANS